MYQLELTMYSERKVLLWSTSFCIAWVTRIHLTIASIKLYVTDDICSCRRVLDKYCVSKF